MEIGDNWGTIRKVFDEAYKSCFHFAVATVNKDARDTDRRIIPAG